MADEAGVLNWAGGEIKGGACPPVAPPPPPAVPEASPDPNDIDLNENIVIDEFVFESLLFAQFEFTIR